MSRPSQRWNEHGATAVEYAIMAGLIAAVIVMGVFVMGRDLGERYDCVASVVGDPASAPNPTIC